MNEEIVLALKDLQFPRSGKTYVDTNSLNIRKCAGSIREYKGSL